MRAAHYCQECGKVQPPVPVDYFSFFGLPLQTEPRHGPTGARLSTPSAASFIPTSTPAPATPGTGLEPGKDLPAQRRLSHSERPDLAHANICSACRACNSKSNRRPPPTQARKTGEAKKQVVPADLLEEVFELNMQLEELRANKKMGEDDPALENGIAAAQAAAGSQAGGHAAANCNPAWN